MAEESNMADENDDEVIVNLSGDTTQIGAAGSVDFNAPDPAIESGKKQVEAEDPLQSLKAQFEQMSGRLTSTETAHQQTQQQLDEARQRLERAEGQVVSSQLDTVLSGIAAATAEADTAQQEFIAASEAGDFAAVARAQRKIASAEARKVRLEEAKDDLEDAAQVRKGTQQQHSQQRPQPQQKASGDPVEDAITQGRVPPKSAAWLRAHPECITDPSMNKRMLAAHYAAEADGIPIESDEYFKRIEAGVKPVSKQSKPAERRPSSAAAPANGQSGGMNGGGTEVRLTRGEAASATDGTLVWNYDDPSGQKKFKKGDPIGLAEMARRKHEGMKAGLYDKSQA
jgi:uncharacterized phage infection (PIP) family protein YhgE